jgi:hypothetical protein
MNMLAASEADLISSTGLNDLLRDAVVNFDSSAGEETFYFSKA